MASATPTTFNTGVGDYNDIDPVVRLVAGHLYRNGNPRGRTGPRAVSVDWLSDAIDEVTVETQLAGAALLTIQVIDPAWALRRSGLLTPTQGILPQVDVQYPESGVWWRLAMVETDDEAEQDEPNVELTFQQRIVSYLASEHGPLAAPAGETTVAQFIQFLSNRVPKRLDKDVLGPGSSGIRYIAPDLNIVQPVASSTDSGTTMVVLTTDKTADATAKVNKQPSVGAGAAVTIKGQTPTSTQLQLINEVMGIAVSLNAPKLAIIALLEACIQENDFTNSGSGSGSSVGLLQFESGTAADLGIDPLNVEQCVTAFLTRAYSAGMDGYKGAIDYAQQHPTASADSVAQAAQGSGYPTAYGQWLGEADAIFEAYGGDAATLGTATAQSDIAAGQIGRGMYGAATQSEDSWTCIQRLASDRNWSAFTSPSPKPGIFQDCLYYISGPSMQAQTPALYLTLNDDGETWTGTGPGTKAHSLNDVVTSFSGTLDNSSLQYQTALVRHGKVQKPTRIRTPETPTQLMFSINCAPMEFNAGDVVVIQGTDLYDGRWIIADVTHNTLQDRFAQITLGPPTLPNPEPAAQTTTTTSGTGTGTTISSGTTGDLSKVVSLAKQAAALEAESGNYTYTQGAGRTNDGHSPLQSPWTYDCSGFCGGCYLYAGVGAPYGSAGYTGWTGDIPNDNLQQVSATDAIPGDLVLFPDHVVIYIGDGQCVSMGAQGEPKIMSVSDEAAYNGRGVTGYFHLKSAS